MKLKLALLTGLMITTMHAAGATDEWDDCSDLPGLTAENSGTSASISIGVVAYQKMVGNARDVIADNKATQKEVETQIGTISELLDKASSQEQKEQLNQILAELITKLDVVMRVAVNQSSRDGFIVTK